MQKATKYIPIIGILLFIWIIFNIGFERLAEIFGTINPVYLLMIFPVIAVNILLKAVRWKRILGIIGFKYSIRDSYIVTVTGIFAGILTPGRIGEFVRALYLRNAGLSLGRALLSVFLDRLLDVLVLVFFGAACLIWFNITFSAEVVSLGLILILLVLVVFLTYLMTKRKYIVILIRPLYKKFFPEKHKEKIRLNFDDFYSHMVTFRGRRKDLALLIAVTFISWLLVAFQTYLLALSLSINISYFVFVLIVPILTLVELMPVSVSGLGTREATMIFLLSFFGISAEIAVAFSVLYLIFNLWIFVPVGALFWYRKPVKINL